MLHRQEEEAEEEEDDDDDDDDGEEEEYHGNLLSAVSNMVTSRVLSHLTMIGKE